MYLRPSRPQLGHDVSFSLLNPTRDIKTLALAGASGVADGPARRLERFQWIS